jgi:DNA-binding CsgD family transcriptional regulator
MAVNRLNRNTMASTVKDITALQAETMSLLAAGATIEQIAAQRGVTKYAIYALIRQCRSKLGIKEKANQIREHMIGAHAPLSDKVYHKILKGNKDVSRLQFDAATNTLKGLGVFTETKETEDKQKELEQLRLGANEILQINQQFNIYNEERPQKVIEVDAEIVENIENKPEIAPK